MTTPHIKSIGRSPLRLGLLLIPLALACFAVSPPAQAQLPSPTPDGGYPGENTAEGDGALFSLTTGVDNTATGFQALYSNTTGDQNAAVGDSALYSNTTGFNNTAIGAFALFSNTTGILNTATGDETLFSNTTGDRNTATGYAALYGNTTGARNTADGNAALAFNTAGNDNTATGRLALFSNTTGNNNTADGRNTLLNNTIGSDNTATGMAALSENTTGNVNTATGRFALGNNTTGTDNIAVGYQAGINLTTGSNNIDIGNVGVAGESTTIRIGTQGTQTKTFIAGISVTGVMGTAVKINSSGQLGVAPSSARFKQEIQSMDKASEAILALKPVTFRYKKEIDSERIPQFGLVAEEVEKVNPDLVVRDSDGKPYTVRYEAVNAMLLNEFLKEHRIVQEQGATIARQQKQIEALTAGLQKVSAQVEMSRSAPQVVVNNQ